MVWVHAVAELAHVLVVGQILLAYLKAAAPGLLGPGWVVTSLAHRYSLAVDGRAATRCATFLGMWSRALFELDLAFGFGRVCLDLAGAFALRGHLR